MTAYREIREMCDTSIWPMQLVFVNGRNVFADRKVFVNADRFVKCSSIPANGNGTLTVSLMTETESYCCVVGV